MENALSPAKDADLDFDQLVALVKQLPASKKRKLAMILSGEADEYISKEDVLEGIREGLQDIKLYKEGKIQLKTAREFLSEL